MAGSFGRSNSSGCRRRCWWAMLVLLLLLLDCGRNIFRRVDELCNATAWGSGILCNKGGGWRVEREGW
jgi:hypothetical protein